MGQGSFKNVALTPSSIKWEQAINRQSGLYQKSDDIRTEFARDFTRILHCTAYRRLKHKTQVFFATKNDHICTRIEHVNHVSSVSHTIANYLGLNTELTSAIAIGHDLGHAPFGHAGEKVVEKIVKEKIGDTFWHERNSLRFIDKIETLPDHNGFDQNLCLTYAVRDGIVSHCGEVDENGLMPRDKHIEVENIAKPNQYPPFTWEGCVVKIADKIAYLGRDIEDAISLGILTFKEYLRLRRIAGTSVREINNTVIMHDLIVDLCKNSNPDVGIVLSTEHYELMNKIKKFNYTTIYSHPRIEAYKEYVNLVITSIFSTLAGFYDQYSTLLQLKKAEHLFPELTFSFAGWLSKYSNVLGESRDKKFQNKIIYNMKDQIDYFQAIIDYVSGMSDQYAIKIFNEITSF